MTQPYSSRDKNETAVRLKNTGMPPFVYGSHICGHTVKLDPFKQPQQNTEMHQSWIENVKLFSVSLNQKAQHLMFRGNNTRKRKFLPFKIFSYSCHAIWTDVEWSFIGLLPDTDISCAAQDQQRSPGLNNIVNCTMVRVAQSGLPSKPFVRL